MKKYYLFILFVISVFSTFGQNLGFKNPKDCYQFLSQSEKILLNECLDSLNVKLYSIKGVDEIYDSPILLNCNIKAVVKSDYLFKDSRTQTYTNYLIETLFRNATLMEPKYMVFVNRDTNGSKITVQQYY